MDRPKLRTYDIKPKITEPGDTNQPPQQHVAIPCSSASSSIRSSSVVTTTTTTTTADHRMLIVPKQPDLVSTKDYEDTDELEALRRIDSYDEKCAQAAGFVALPDSNKRVVRSLVVPSKRVCVEAEEDSVDVRQPLPQQQQQDVSGDDGSDTIHTDDSFSVEDQLQRFQAPRRRGRFAPGADASSAASSSSSAPSEDPETRALRLARMRSMIHVHVANPFWTSVFEKCGYWTPPDQCLGCCRDLIRHRRLIDDEITTLVQELAKRLNDGIFSSINWAGSYFRENVYELYKGELTSDNDRQLWEKWCRGINIIGHFYDHANYEILMQKFKGLEYADCIKRARDTICYRTLNDPHGTIRIDRYASNSVSKLELLKLRLTTANPKNSCFFEPSFEKSDAHSTESSAMQRKRTNKQA